MIRRRLALVPALLAVALLAGGCASSPAHDTGRELQLGVVAVASAAAGADYSAALDELDSLQARLDDAIDAGSLSTEQAASIQESIDVVRADLATLIEPEETPEPSATPTVEEPVTPETPAEPVGPDKPAKGNNKDEKPGKGNKNKP